MRTYVHKGSSNPNSRLTEEKVREIRWMSSNGLDAKGISKHFNVSISLVYKILSGERWGHVDG